MFYYNVAKIGTGIDGDSTRPDIPDGVSWVGAELNDGTFLVGSQATIGGLIPLTDSQLYDFCDSTGISYSDVTAKWLVT